MKSTYEAAAHAVPRMDSFIPTQPSLFRAGIHAAPARATSATARSTTRCSFVFQVRWILLAVPFPPARSAAQRALGLVAWSPMRLDWECEDRLAISFSLVTGAYRGRLSWSHRGLGTPRGVRRADRDVDEKPREVVWRESNEIHNRVTFR